MKAISWSLAVLLTATFALPCPGAFNRPGSLDRTFDPTSGGHQIGLAQCTSIVTCLARQNDGKVLVGGQFIGVDGGSRNRVARLLSDGTLDATFEPGSGADGPLVDLALQADGKVLLVGGFGNMNGSPRCEIARLNTDGSVDTGFHPEIGLYLHCVTVQSDGRILVGGSFTNVNGSPRVGIARLNADGTLDATFDASLAITNRNCGATALRVQSDGKILVAGFTRGLNQPLLRLNPNGSQDGTFHVPTIQDVPYIGWVYTLKVDAQDRILVGGRFKEIDGMPRPSLARLLADGSLDLSFAPPAITAAGSGSIGVIEIQTNGLLAGGNFTNVGGLSRKGIARFLADGQLDASFDPGETFDGPSAPWLDQLACTADGGVLVASGTLGSYSCCSSPLPLCRLTANGALDPAFHTPDFPGPGQTRVMTPRPDGKLLIGLSSEQSYNGFQRCPVALLKPDGTLDTSFAPALAGPSPSVITLLNDGRILVGGLPFDVNGSNVVGLVRLQPDGKLDPSFPLETCDGEVYIRDLTPQTDGKVIVTGSFRTLRGSGPYIARLNPNGTIDPSFNLDPALAPDPDDDAPVGPVAVQPDGKILIGGLFFGGGNQLLRLLPDGSVDHGFQPWAGRVLQIVVESDGHILVGGSFWSLDEANPALLLRLEPDGRLQTVFATTAWQLDSMAVQADGKVLTSMSPGTCGLLRFNRDGSLDHEFQAEIKTTLNVAWIQAIAVQRDGRVLIAGDFTSVDGVTMHGVARLNNELGGAPFTVTRQLPHLTGDKSVRLFALPSSNVVVYAVEDQPPAGWPVSNVSPGGIFDAANGKVKFGPYFDAVARTLSYDVWPPPGATNPGVFHGQGSADGVVVTIGGESLMFIVQTHPADQTPEDWRLSIGEVTAYGMAWRTGNLWPVPPNPIPIDYVTKAGGLWRGGEKYLCDFSFGPPPACWVFAPATNAIQFAESDGSQTAGVATRAMSPTFVPGVPVTVTIAFAALEGTGAHAVEERVPANWRIASVSDGGYYDAVAGAIRWGPFVDDQARCVTYQVNPPTNAQASAWFSGQLSVDGASKPVAGLNRLRPACRLHPMLDFAAGCLQLELTSEPGETLLIEVSDDLVKWTPLTTVTNLTGSLQLLDSQAPHHTQRFYRALMP